MLWHPRCRWPARLSLPPTPRHGPRKNAYTHVPRSPRLVRHARCFLVKCPKRGDGPDLDGSHLLELLPKCDCQGLASTSRPRCSHSRMKSSSNPPLRLWVKRRDRLAMGLRPLYPGGLNRSPQHFILEG